MMPLLRSLLTAFAALAGAGAQGAEPTLADAHELVRYALSSKTELNQYSRDFKRFGVIRHMDAKDRVRAVPIVSQPVFRVSSSECATKFSSFYVGERQHNDEPYLDARESESGISWKTVYGVLQSDNKVTVQMPHGQWKQFVFTSGELAGRFLKAATFLKNECSRLPETGF